MSIESARRFLGQLVAPSAVLVSDSPWNLWTSSRGWGGGARDINPYTDHTRILIYWVARSKYNLKFRPLSRFPGPRLAAVSNLWWAYARWESST